MKYDCLIVDDEIELSQSTCEYFNIFDVKTAWVGDKQACLDFFIDNQADLILLDINLGDESGFELCKILRQTMAVPILFISARTSDDDKLLAFNIGGDDYISKPYSLSVLLAKVKATLKRSNEVATTAATTMEVAPAQNTTDSSTLSAGDFSIDFLTNTVSIKNKKINLKTMEFKLFAYLVQNKNRIVTKQDIFSKVWEESFVGDNTLNVHIRHLREKIEKDAKDPVFIKTVWGTGYIFEVDES